MTILCIKPSHIQLKRYGGNGSAIDGTEFACQMQVAATGDSQYAKHLAMISAQEGKALGVNWTFAPVVDIDINPHNPITNVRTFGSNGDTVTLFAKQYVQEMVEQNMATSPKHFRGSCHIKSLATARLYHFDSVKSAAGQFNGVTFFLEMCFDFISSITLDFYSAIFDGTTTTTDFFQFCCKQF
ncbi:Glycosyl hydrolase family 3 N terminal domain-containing protein [Vibrio xiamenensis]|uniref:beta-N-acetylhexosaminidase n=1 Tax=Vibrio xiamenensis TaxID=861298 RepID=A0A1G7YTM6_9VIBR|nr:Glycosyl hydrolase family 3 N terminal domain-containing protein [Vibrio xiamenensis]